jgi:hypothetical protein
MIASKEQQGDIERTVYAAGPSGAIVLVGVAPAVLGLGYPWYLATLHDFAAARHVVLAFLALALTLAVPASAFTSLYVLGRQSTTTPSRIALQRLAHLTFASPPLYVILGVFLYLMKINGADAKVWIVMWLTILCGTLLVLISEPKVGSAATPVRLNAAPVRVAHGAASITIIVLFLFPHLGNHVVAILGVNTHRAVMLALRHLYRAGLIEPALISLFLFQIVSGLVLIGRKIGSTRQDLLIVLQTASGAYLVIFIASHMNAVFVLARYFGTDTDYAWATGLPTGLLADTWNVRLIPHYGLGVWLVLAHIACGLRTVMLAHNVPKQRANVICWAAIVLGTLWSAMITAGMMGTRI